MSGVGMTLLEPEPLAEPSVNPDTEKHHTLTQLNGTDTWFREISLDFNNAGMIVNKIEILKNKHLWKRYSSERNLLLEQRRNIGDAGFRLNERYLYHGTSAQKSDICDQGLDFRMSKEGCFGKGIYFSDYPKKCVKYARKGKNDESYILLVRVILGRPKVYPDGTKARSLQREPEREIPFTGHKFYDSVEGCPVNHKEFVVYESRRALVEGIISFSVEEKKESKEKVEAESLSDDNDSDDQSSGEEEVTETNSINYDSSSDSDDVDKHLKTEEKVEKVLTQKRNNFRIATKVTDEFEIDRFLLRGDMIVEDAIQIYEKLKNEGLQNSHDEDGETAHAKEHPVPYTEGWNQLNKEDQEAFIEGQIDDFITITGLKNCERSFARNCLAAVNMNLDLAVLAYYEDLDD